MIAFTLIYMYGRVQLTCQLLLSSASSIKNYLLKDLLHALFIYERNLVISFLNLLFITSHSAFTWAILHWVNFLLYSTYPSNQKQTVYPTNCYIMSAKDSSMVPSRNLKTEGQLARARSLNHVEPNDSSIIATIQDHDERELAQMGYKQVRGC